MVNNLQYTLKKIRKRKTLSNLRNMSKQELHAMPWVWHLWNPLSDKYAILGYYVVWHSSAK